MKIIIDLQGAQSESRFRGIGRYSRSLSKEIAKQASSNEVYLLLNQHLPDAIDEIKKEFSNLLPENNILTFDFPVPVAGMKVLNNQWRVRAAEILRESFIATLNPDIVFVSSLFEGWLDDAVTSIGTFDPHHITAVSLFDLIPLHNPEMYLPTQFERHYFARKIESLKKANVLLSISEYSRQEGISALDLPEEKIVNVSTAANEIFKKIEIPEQEIQSFFNRYDIPETFIMYSGGFDPRKNLQGLFTAFSLLDNKIREKYPLVIVGVNSPSVKNWLHELARQQNILDAVYFVEYVTDEDLIKFYNLCSLFVFPSLHEGFGMPALEAMSCGAAVIGSNLTSVPEVIGCKEALFNPNNPDEIAEKITKVLLDEDFRNFLCAHGENQTRKFSWAESARKTLETFESIYEEKDENSQRIFTIDKNNYTKLIDSLSAIDRVDEKVSTDDLYMTAQAIYQNEKMVTGRLRSIDLDEHIDWQIEGTFHDSYSLSLLNRETARALHRLGHKVSIWSSTEPGFYMPSDELLSEFFDNNPDIEKFYKDANQINNERINDKQVVSRNIYPPIVSTMEGRINLLHHYAWEESEYPHEYLKNFNKYLQGITCLSRFVEKVLIDNGVTVPLSTSEGGVDHWERIESDKHYFVEARSFKFLHVSSCFPRKGVDILLDAYGDTFSDTSDVSLIIKTFENPHNHIHQMLSKRVEENEHYPHVLIIEEELTDSQLKSLYEQCDALVGPSRGEGFGLPFAEAILSGLPVITTRWGGQLDFCNDDTTWLVDYHFTRAKTHFNLSDSVWAEPDKSDLAAKLKEVYNASPEEKTKKIENGRKLLLSYFRWDNVAQRLVDSARKWSTIPAEPKPRIGWITTWNTKCGIAAYSKHLVSHLPASVNVLAARTNILTAEDEPFVKRCWYQDVRKDKIDNLGELTREIDEQKLDTLIIQFNYGFFDFESLNNFILHQIECGRIVMVTFHSTTDIDDQPKRKLSILLPALSRCHRLLVHSINDLNRLKELGLVENVMLFPHGVVNYHSNGKPPATDKIVIASYGFFLPHKGLLELIDAFALLVKKNMNIKLLMLNAEYPINVSARLISQAKAKISKLGISNHVELMNDYLPDKESLDLMANANLIVFPYQNSGESTSASVRYGLATGCPIAVTPLPIFDDVASAVYHLPGCSPAEICEGISQILDEINHNTDKAQKTEEMADQWRNTHYYSHLADRLYRVTIALNRKYSCNNELITTSEKNA